MKTTAKYLVAREQHQVIEALKHVLGGFEGQDPFLGCRLKEPQPVVEKKPLAKQEVMQFEPVTRGRFEKSEPTIVEGQDLDVPTFLRKNVRVK